MKKKKNSWKLNLQVLILELNLFSLEDEFNYAVKMTDISLRRLTKAHLMEL
jgi:hypothetical protein